jgi:hypothetical protein
MVQRALRDERCIVLRSDSKLRAPRSRGESPETAQLQLGQHDSLLRLIFPFAIFVAGFADLIGLKEQDLAEAFVGVDFCGQRRGVRNFEGDEALPLRLKGRDVDDDAAAGVSGFADANGEDVAGNFEVLDGARECEGVGRDDGDIGIDGDKGALVEVFRVDDGTVDVGENLELVGDTEVVSIAGDTVGNHTLTDLLFGVRVNHVVFLRHSADPAVRLNHGTPWDFLIL